MFLGDNAGSNGTYNLSGTGKPHCRHVDRWLQRGSARSTRAAAANTTLSNALVLGNFTGSSGTYNLTGTGKRLPLPWSTFGYNAGSNVSPKAAATNAASNAGSGAFLRRFTTPVANGNYTLSGTGTLTADLEIVGNSGHRHVHPGPGAPTPSAAFWHWGSTARAINATNNSNGNLRPERDGHPLDRRRSHRRVRQRQLFTQSSGTNHHRFPRTNSSGMVYGWGGRLGANSSSSGIYHLDGGTLQNPDFAGKQWGRVVRAPLDFNGGPAAS